MTQQLIAIIIILYFIYQQTSLFKKGNLSKNEYFFWLFFWLTAGLLIVAIHYIDTLVHNLGLQWVGKN